MTSATAKSIKNAKSIQNNEWRLNDFRGITDYVYIKREVKKHN
jgi:hypothetical protein